MGTDIIKVDYRHCKEAELIALTIEHKELILKENKISFFSGQLRTYLWHSQLYEGC